MMMKSTHDNPILVTACKPAGMQQDQERVRSGVCLHSAQPAQPGGIAARMASSMSRCSATKPSVQ